MNKFTAIMTTALLVSSFGTARADEIGLTTNKAVGEQIEFALNADLSATLTWGNGETETCTFDGTPKTFTLKDQSLTITTEGNITRFYAPSAGLTALNVSGAAKLEKLLIPENSLTTLSLTKNTALVDLDCQGNDLTELTTSNARSLQNINCANNDLTKMTYSTLANVQTLVCSGNELDTLKYQTSMSRMQSFWCDNNSFRTLNLSKSTALKTLVAADNAIYSLQMPTAAAELTDIWLASNKLDTLDVSIAPSLVALDVTDNNLYKITWDKTCKATLTHFLAGGNGLLFGSFPTPTDELTAVYMPQEPYNLGSRFVVNVRQDWSDLLFYNGFGVTSSSKYVLTNAAGEELVAKTDYTASVGKFTFKTLQTGVVMTITSTKYPDVTLTTEPFDITDATAIHGVTTDAAGLSFTTSAGELHAAVAADTVVKVYDAAGRLVINEHVSAGNYSWTLAPGIYVAGGSKILVPNL